jgi:hypothetical protein
MDARNLGWKAVFCSLIILWAMIITPPSAEAALFSQSAPDLTFGAPTWYTDLSPGDPAALPLVACVDVADGLCVLPFAGEEPDWDPALPPTFGPPVNFPSEPFYHLVEAGVALDGGGSGFLRLALEFAFGGITGDPVDGEQIVFNRVRHRIQAPVTGRYRITHPWGTFEQDVLVLGAGLEINSTIDEGCAVLPCDFNLALNDAPGRITGPFLRWDANFPVIGAVSGASYLGDPAIPHKITGSVHIDPVSGQPANLYRVEVDEDFGGAGGFRELGRTDQFFVMGRLFAAPGPPPANTPPVANNDLASTITNTPVDINVAGNDTDVDLNLDPGSIAIVTGPTQGTVALNTPAPGWIRYTPNPGTFGTDTFTYNIRDTLGLVSNTATVAVTVNATDVVDITIASLSVILTFQVQGTVGPNPQTGLSPTSVQVFAGTAPPSGPLCAGMTFLQTRSIRRGAWKLSMRQTKVRSFLGGSLPTHACARSAGGGFDVQVVTP